MFALWGLSLQAALHRSHGSGAVTQHPGPALSICHPFLNAVTQDAVSF